MRSGESPGAKFDAFERKKLFSVGEKRTGSLKIWKADLENLKIRNKEISRRRKIQKLLIFGPDKGHIWTGVHFELAQKRRFRYQVKTENSKNSKDSKILKNSHWPQIQKHRTWAYSKNFRNRLRIWEKRKNGKCRRLNRNERKRIIFCIFYVFDQNSRNFGTNNQYYSRLWKFCISRYPRTLFLSPIIHIISPIRSVKWSVNNW